jgi:triosephosphate isomerase
MVHFKDPFEKLEKENETGRNLRKPLIAGNWKMNKVLTEAIEYALDLKKRVSEVPGVETLICAPYPFLSPLSKTLEDSPIKIGAQDLYWEPSGAFTGAVSAQMLESVGCSYVIVGHSERRHIFGESSEDVNKKTRAALGAFLTPVVCVGEKLEEREATRTEEVLRDQVTVSLGRLNSEEMLKCVVAYEPVWAIGTGKTATPHQANETQLYVRGLLKEMFGEDVSNRTRILYGGSVKPDNVADLMAEPNIDGVLVGGASLEVESFEKLVKYREIRAEQTGDIHAD